MPSNQYNSSMILSTRQNLLFFAKIVPMASETICIIYDELFSSTKKLYVPTVKVLTCDVDKSSLDDAFRAA